MRKLHSNVASILIGHLGIVIALSVFIVQALLLPRIGMSWDEPASFFIGRANLKFWTTGNRAYVDDIKNKELFRDSPIQYIYGEDIYPPVPFLLPSAVSAVFAETLHIMDVYTAHHLGELIIATVGIWALYGLAIEAGLAVPLAAGVSLIYALYPTIIDMMRADPKDMPLVSLLIVSAYFAMRVFRNWRKKNTLRVWTNGLVFSVFFGLAACTKPTAAFIVPVFVIWIVLACLRNVPLRREFPVVRFTSFWVILITLAVAVFFFMWPWAWVDPVARIGETLSFFKTVGYNMPTTFFGTIYHAGVNLPRIYAYVILLIQTPIEITLLVIVGTIYVTIRFIKKGFFYPFLFVIWFWLLICRFLIPHFIIYSKVRHFIDAMPAFFILAGFGALSIGELISHRRKIVIASGLLLFVVAHQLWISYRFFPYEGTYYNFLTGGTKTVARKQLFDIGPATGVKEAVEFINRDSEGKQTRIYPCLMSHVIRFYAASNVIVTSKPEYGRYVIVPNAISWFEGALTFWKNQTTPSYVIQRDGGDLFYVYKNEQPFGWRCGWETTACRIAYHSCLQ
jgi:hypothetical protein